MNTEQSWVLCITSFRNKDKKKTKYSIICKKLGVLKAMISIAMIKFFAF